jgi:hypothetical protein
MDVVATDFRFGVIGSCDYTLTVETADVAEWQTQRTLNCGFRDFLAFHCASNLTDFTCVDHPDCHFFRMFRGRAEVASFLHKLLHTEATDFGSETTSKTLNGIHRLTAFQLSAFVGN